MGGPAPLFLGIDLGTSALKVAAVTPEGRLAALARVPLRMRHLGEGRVEGDPEAWWRALQAGVRAVSRRVGLGRVAGIGVCGQTRAQVLLDAGGRVLRPAILWADRRAVAEAEELAEMAAGDVTLAAAVGSAAPSAPIDATAPLARLLWLRRHEPHVLERAHRLLQPKDFLVRRLTGEWASDAPSNVHLLVASDPPRPTPLLDRLGIGTYLLPPLRAPWEVVAGVTARAAGATGLAPVTPVVAGTQDGLAAALGLGGARPGVAVDVAGSADTVGIFSRRAPSPGPVAAVPLGGGLIFCGGPTQATGEAVRWFMERVVGASRGRRGGPTEIGTLTRLAARGAPGEVLFLPYLGGARAPVWEAGAVGVFFGLAPAHGLGDLARAVLEGIALSVRHLLEAAEAAAGERATEVRIGGPAAGSAAWSQLRADVLGRPVVRPAVVEGGVLGAALLAAVGVGHYGDVAEATARMVRAARTYRPGARARDYDRIFETYRELVGALRPAFRGRRRASV